MKMPNFASLYHCGCWYLISVAQSGRKGPSFACFSSSASNRLRSASYLLTDCCHSRSISTADFTPSVGARGSVDGACAKSIGPPVSRRSETQRSWFISTDAKWRNERAANAFKKDILANLEKPLDIFPYRNA